MQAKTEKSREFPAENRSLFTLENFFNQISELLHATYLRFLPDGGIILLFVVTYP